MAWHGYKSACIVYGNNKDSYINITNSLYALHKYHAGLDH